MTSSDGRLTLKVRRGRNAAALVLLLVLSSLALWVGYQQRAELGADDWWVLLFPVLAMITAYRHFRPRTPMVLDEDGVHVVTGMPLLGLRSTFEWAAIKRLRVTAAGLLLVELKNSQAWAEQHPWLVRANVRANERRTKAAVVQPLRELAGRPEEIILAIRTVAPVKVEAPQALGGRA